MDAKMDAYGARGLLGNGETEAIPIRATRGGELRVAETGTLEAVVSVDLSAAHTGEQIYTGSFSELTFAVVDAPVQVNFVDGADAGKYVSLSGKASIGAAGTGLWLRNQASVGSLEIWIWR